MNCGLSSSSSGVSKMALLLLLGVSLSNGNSISNTWEGVGIISDLNPGDIVTIRGRQGTYLRATTDTNKVSSKNRFEDNRMLWKVGTHKDDNDVITGYTFHNEEKGCYLISKDGYLKCQDLNQNYDSSWNKADSSTINYFYNNARYFTRLQNNNDGRCMNIDNNCNGDNNIKMRSSYCNDADTELVYFERITPLSLANRATNNLYEQWNSFSNLEGNNNLLQVNDLVYIRSFWSGLFLKSSGTGDKVKFNSEIDTLQTLWKVTDVKSTTDGNGVIINEYQFYNDYDSCYMRHDNGAMRCKSSESDNSYWSYYNGNSEIVNDDDDSTFQRSYMPLWNVKKEKCIDITTSGSLCSAGANLSGGSCGNKDSLVYFERFGTA